MKQTLLLLAGTALCSVAGADILWDTGAPHTVINGGVEGYTGFSSGNISGAPQRWAAIPFRIGAPGAVINEVDADWFVVAGSEAATVDYIIWQRVGLAAPTVMYASGSLGAFGPGVDDPRIPGTEDWFHAYMGLSIPVVAGDYYFTIYGNGIGTGNTTGFSNAPWLTGGDLQDETLEQPFMWRSVSFPAPGFVMYAPGTILPGTGMTDPDDRWNPSFALIGVPEPATMLALAGGLAALKLRRRKR